MSERVRVIRFADLVTQGRLAVGDGYRAKLEELGGSGPLFLRAGALSDEGFDWSHLDAFFVDTDALKSKHGAPADVVITTKGNSIGRVGYVPETAPEFVYSPHLSFWRSLDTATIVPRYLYFWSRSSAFRKQLSNLGFGTDMAPYLSLRDQLSLRIALPDAVGQRAIAEVLGALDDKIAANARVAACADRLACAQFAQALRTAEWSGSTFGDLAYVSGGGTPSTKVAEYWDGDINWATPTDVTGLRAPYLEGTARRITPSGLEACASALHPAGSILMTSRATIGAFAIAQGATAVNQGFIVVNAKRPELQWWLFHEMRSRVDEFLSHANGATFLELSRGNFKRLPVRLAEESVMEQFSAVAEPLHARARGAALEDKRLEQMRDALLPQLMSGKIRVKDAERAVSEVV